MYDAFIPPLQLMAGNVILFGFLPFTIALGVGLIWLGLVRQRFSAVFGGLGLIAFTAVIGIALREGALASPNAPEGIEATANSLQFFLPYSIGMAAVVFLVTLLPAIVRAHRQASS